MKRMIGTIWALGGAMMLLPGPAAAVPATPVPSLQAEDSGGNVEVELTQAESYYRRGVEFMNNSRYLDAVELFQLALDEDPQYIDAHRRLAYAYTQMAKTEEDYYLDALDVYEDLQALLPEDDVDVRKNIAFVQAAMGDVDDAIETYTGILEITPEDCGVWSQIGAAEKLQADRLRPPEGEESPDYDARLKKAVDAYVKVTELCPDSLAAYNTLGEIYFATGQMDEAAGIYETLVEKNPEDMTTLVRLAYLYYEAENWTKAAPIYEMILAQDTDNVSARQRYAKCLQKLGQYAESATQYQMIIDKDPEKYGSLYCNIANVYALDAKDGEKAIETAMKGIAENAPVKGCLTYFWGKGLELRATDLVKEGKYDRAIITYREAKLKFQSILGDANFGAHATKQLDRLEQLITIAEQTKEKAKQQGR